MMIIAASAADACSYPQTSRSITGHRLHRAVAKTPATFSRYAKAMMAVTHARPSARTPQLQDHADVAFSQRRAN